MNLKNPTYINAISSISFQNFLENKSLSGLQKLQASSELVQANYKQWLKPMQLRRMSKIVRMSLACSKDIISQIETDDFDSIIVGTGLGCIKDTVKFIDTINSVSTSSIPPTAFIQSTHNTIAGQIALQLSNNNYNMTYVQNGVSFEHSLLDAQLKILEGKTNILVGALDEMIDYLQSLAKLANIENSLQYTEGSAFFNLTKNKDNKVFAELLKTMTFSIDENFNISKSLDKFLETENINLNDIDIIFKSSPKFSSKDLNNIEFKNTIFYEHYCGKYFTSSAFGFYLACQSFKEDINTINSIFDLKISTLNYSLIINNYMDKVIGFTLLKKVS